MTLVVSDITRHGIVMVGDSAVTVMQNDEIVDIREEAAKVQYSPAANVGITMWGNGSIDGTSMDSWIAEFIEASITPGDDIEDIALRLAEQLNADLSRMGKSWNELRGGLHIAGYKNDLPRLWHIHTGPANEPQHELQLHLDFPELKGLNDIDFRVFLSQDEDTFPKYCHLRNGYIPHFAALFDSMMRYSRTLRALYIRFPQDSLEGRLTFYKLLVQFVAETLVAAGKHPGVNNVLSAIAFNQSGLVFDERILIREDIQNVPEGFHLGF